MNEKKKGRQPGVKNYTVGDDHALLETVLRLKMNWALIIEDLHNNQHRFTTLNETRLKSRYYI